MKRLNLKGSTIVEVLVAASLITIAVLASLALNSTSQRQTDFSRSLNQATVYNNQALDWLRTMRGYMGWRSLVNELELDTNSGSVTYCLSTLPNTIDQFAALTPHSCDNNDEADKIINTNFLREIDFTMSGSPVDKLSITISTSWDNKAHKATDETVLTEW